MAKFRFKILRKKPNAGKQRISKYGRALREGVRRSAVIVHRSAVESIMEGNKTGRMYGSHRASAPGEAPATDTGYLASNIIFVIDSDGLGASIESRADYSAYLEFGTSQMAARPFMVPAVEQNRTRIRRLMRDLAKAKGFV